MFIYFRTEVGFLESLGQYIHDVSYDQRHHGKRGRRQRRHNYAILDVH